MNILTRGWSLFRPNLNPADTQPDFFLPGPVAGDFRNYFGTDHQKPALPDSSFLKYSTFAMCMALAGVILLAADSEAAITFSNPTRTLSSSNNKGGSQDFESLGYEPLNTSVGVDWSEYWTASNQTGAYQSTASQESSIGPTSIAASGSVTGGGSFEFWGTSPLHQSSISYFEIDFTLDTSTTIFLTGVLSLTVDQGGTNFDTPKAWVKLLHGATESYFTQVSTFQFAGSYAETMIDYSGTLGAGAYKLVAYAETLGDYNDLGGGPGFGGYGNATYDFALVPEPSSCLLVCLGSVLVLGRRNRRN